METKLEFSNDEVWEKIPKFDNFYEAHLVMTKEIFIECYKKWILEEDKEFEVWLEGYSATGQEGKHQYIGKEKAKDFKEACYKAIKKWCNNDKDFEEYYDSEKCTFWGCRCFDNEADSMYFD